MLRGEPYVVVSPNVEAQGARTELPELADRVIASVRDRLLDGGATSASQRALFPGGVTKLELELSLNVDDGFKVKVVVAGPDGGKT